MPITVRGNYDEKQTFVVKEIIKLPESIPPSLCRKSQTSRIRIVVAVGPFILKDGEVYPVKLVDHAVRWNADTLIIIGPLLQENDQPSGAMSVKRLFRLFIKGLSDAVSKQKLRIIVIPSHCDVNAVDVFPTPPYDVPDDCLAHNVIVLADPAIFTIDGVHFAVSASGIVDHLIEQEVLQFQEPENQNQDSISRAISYMFSSQSLYPLYPPDKNLKFSTKSKEKVSMTKRPHVLILPSVLKPSIKVVEGCVCLNPGQFTRLECAATFTSLEIDLNSASIALSNSIADHIQVNIIQ
uniref:DNA polymerase alpha subunit B n=1 Tax=Ditylenchus dipsaci TaxID=166011 RepID=A0A915E8A7_9BILA